jgi:hypothetical protein
MRYKFRVYYATPFDDEIVGYKLVNARTAAEAVEKFQSKNPYYIAKYAI